MDQPENTNVENGATPTTNTPEQSAGWKQILFPISTADQLKAAFISLFLVIAGAVLGDLSGVWNLNNLAPIIVGFFFSRKIHPVFAAGPAAVAFSVMGIWWVLALVTGMNAIEETSLAITMGGLNIFLFMTTGSLLAMAYKKLTQKPARQ